MRGVLREAGRGHCVLGSTTSLLSLLSWVHVIITQRIDGHTSHVVGGHVVLRHALPGLLRREVGVGWLLRRFDLVRVVHAVLISGGGLRGVEACLGGAQKLGPCLRIQLERLRQNNHT